MRSSPQNHGLTKQLVVFVLSKSCCLKNRRKHTLILLCCVYIGCSPLPKMAKGCKMMQNEGFVWDSTLLTILNILVVGVVTGILGGGHTQQDTPANSEARTLHRTPTLAPWMGNRVVPSRTQFAVPLAWQ